MNTNLSKVSIFCPGCQERFNPNESDTIGYPSPGPHPKDVHIPQKITFCPICQLGLAHPALTEEDEAIIYKQGHYWNPVKPRINIRRLALPLSLAQKRWSFAKMHLKQNPKDRPLRVLDIGSGQGAMGLIMAQEKGVFIGEYWAVEPDERMQSELKQLWIQKKNNH